MSEPAVRTIWLYDGVAQPWFRIEAVREHLRAWLPWLAVEVRGDLLGTDLHRLADSSPREAFCDDPRCRLFNAHWQRELLGAQLGGQDFCGRHRATLAAWRLWHSRPRL
jgi:hypothetical protein